MLTQAEIDALLSGALEVEKPDGMGSVNLAEILGGQPAAPAKELDTERKVQAYNFWSPERFSKEQMRAVELVHEDLAERLTTSMPTLLRTNLRPRVVHTEQGRFHDFLKDAPAGTLFHLITLAPLPGQIVMTISPNVSNMILEQQLGGRSETEGEMKARQLTDIDQSLLRGLVEHMLNDLKGAWSKVVSVEPRLDDSTVNQHWVSMVMGNEKVMLLTFEVSIQGVTGAMSIYIPFGTLKPIASVLNPHVWVSGRKEKQIDPAARKIALENLSQINLQAQVFLGSAVLSLGEVIHLDVGDVIPLDTPVQDDLVMQIANQKLFKVQVGKSGSNLAVLVRSTYQEAETD